MIIVEVILPVICIFLVGYIGQKVLDLDIKSISKASLYLMLPALVFRTFHKTELNETYLYIIIYSLLLTFLIIGLIKIISRLRGYDASLTSALILSTAFMNNGNFGLPIVLFSFGEVAFTYALAINIFHNFVMSTVGIYYATKGKYNFKKSLYIVAKMPIVSAAIAGLLWGQLNLPMPQNIYKAIDLVANATIPTMMLVLGMQVAVMKISNVHWENVSLALVIRLIISPLIAFFLVLALPISSLLAKVMIVQAATPAAVITTMLALEYDNYPDLVASITLLSTLFSIATVSILLLIL